MFAASKSKPAAKGNSRIKARRLFLKFCDTSSIHGTYYWKESTTVIGTYHGVLNQEKYLKSCIGLGPIIFEITTPEVFKTTFREIADFPPSAQWVKVLI